jgi:hypothetical protein
MRKSTNHENANENPLSANVPFVLYDTKLSSRGRLTLEAIITLFFIFGLVPVFIFNQQLQQQRQLEEVNSAEAIKTLKDSVKRYVNVHWKALTNIKDTDKHYINGVEVPPVPFEGDVWSVAIDDPELATFLPPGFSTSNTFNQTFKVVIKRRLLLPIDPRSDSGGECRRRCFITFIAYTFHE